MSSYSDSETDSSSDRFHFPSRVSFAFHPRFETSFTIIEVASAQTKYAFTSSCQSLKLAGTLLFLSFEIQNSEIRFPSVQYELADCLNGLAVVKLVLGLVEFWNCVVVGFTGVIGGKDSYYCC